MSKAPPLSHHNQNENATFELDFFNHKHIDIKEINTLIKDKLEKIRENFESAKTIRTACDIGVRQRAKLIDQIINGINTHLEIKLSHKFSGCLIAVGGYGRSYLSPHSDLDICFIVPIADEVQNKKYIIEFEKMIWDLGFKPSLTTRTIENIILKATEDHILQTSFLDHRYLYGSKKHYRNFSLTFKKKIIEVSRTDFIAQKLKERELRHIKQGNSRYHLEPNIKESKGGLRDLQTLYWIARYLFDVSSIDQLVEQKILNKTEAKTFNEASDFLWVLRTHLHYLAGYAEERLLFDLQLSAAKKMHRKNAPPQEKAMSFMKQYFKIARNIGHLTMIFCTALEDISITGGATAASIKPFKQMLLPHMQPLGFTTEGHRINIPNSNHFKKHPEDMITIFHAALQTQLPLHPNAWKALSRSVTKIDDLTRKHPKSNKHFLDILLSPKGAEDTLRHMNESGVLGSFIPDFDRIIAHMQYDRYHVYTADEHLIRAVGILHDIENGDLYDTAKLATETFQQSLHSRRALYVAILLHDIAKGRNQDHSIVGETIAQELCPRLGLSNEETETVCWLVRNHLVMSDQAFRRDLNDPRTITNFVNAIQSPERLKLMYILTVADIMAVGPERWNNWKSSLLTTLFYKTMEKLTGHSKTTQTSELVTHLKKQVHHILGPQIKSENIFDKAPESYWINFDAETIAKHFAYVLSQQPLCVLNQNPLYCYIKPKKTEQITELMFYTQDQKGLFTKISGALALSNANIVDARIFTFLDGMALDVFRIQNLKGQVFDNIQDLERNIKNIFTNATDVDQSLTKKKQAVPKQNQPTFSKQPRVVIDNSASSRNTVIEVNADDRPALLYDITTCLTQLGLQVSSAKIATYGQNIIDVFYVRDGFGLKILHTEKLKTIKEELFETLNKT